MQTGRHWRVLKTRSQIVCQSILERRAGHENRELAAAGSTHSQQLLRQWPPPPACNSPVCTRARQAFWRFKHIIMFSHGPISIQHKPRPSSSATAMHHLSGCVPTGGDPPAITPHHSRSQSTRPATGRGTRCGVGSVALVGR